MHSRQESGGAELAFLSRLAQVSSRRTFLKWSGITLGVAAVGCKTDVAGPGDSVSLGTGDTAVLNYAYVLEQLEAAFYIQVARTPYTGITTPELQILTDIRDHEVIHRDFLETALGADAVSKLEFDFTNIDFTSRSEVLNAAKGFEDLGVSAYNGAGPLLTDANLLAALGSIVSVEARHAAVLRDILAPKNAAAGFAGDDVVDVNGLDRSALPSQVLASATDLTHATITSSLP